MHGLQQMYYEAKVATELFIMKTLFHREFLSTFFVLILTILAKYYIV